VPGGDHLDLAHEPRRSVHVPDPRVGELDLEPHAAGRLVLLQFDVVRQVEPPLGLDDIREHGHDVSVLSPQADLKVVLEPLDVLVAHGSNSRRSIATGSSSSSEWPSSSGSAWPAGPRTCPGTGFRKRWSLAYRR